MNDSRNQDNSAEACLLLAGVDMSGVEVIRLTPVPAPTDYRAAMTLADTEAGQHLGDYMLLSWYDRDRDFEAP